jgi:hypothetical protein
MLVVQVLTGTSRSLTIAPRNTPSHLCLLILPERRQYLSDSALCKGQKEVRYVIDVWMVLTRR